MKKILCLIAAALAVFAFSANAGLQPLTLDGTNTCVALSTNTYTDTAANTAYTGQSTDVTIVLSCTASNIGQSATINWVFKAGVDNAIWEPRKLVIPMATTANTTNTLTVTTNLPAGYRWPLVRFVTLENTCTNTGISSATVKVFTKDGF